MLELGSLCLEYKVVYLDFDKFAKEERKIKLLDKCTNSNRVSR